ncbi:DUF2591 domain-containing protein [Leclercia adecarboxylata]|uniref:phage protein NinX family protein n=1 Tax=Leclercia adecarboxylata TaxID=83655 RepID=UPI000E3D3067|nr:phage protein NinX family protein [Leclercia adecarboxylata]RFS80596.1 DUF2591 domain-containing protein [Leclercia adecarboxylata]
MDYSKLSDFEINKLVGDVVFKGLWSCRPGSSGNNSESWYYGNADTSLNPLSPLPDYCNNPADAWPIITRNYISLMYEESLGKWCAGKPYWVDGCEWQLDIDVIDENPLRAAMIVFFMMQESANVQTDSSR